MNRFWSLIFFAVPILAVITFAMANWGVAPFEHLWFGKSLSKSGETIDLLFNSLHILSAIILLGTGLAIGWCMWKFDHRHQTNTKAAYFSHNTKLEIVWTIIPALILFGLAFAQMGAWAENKMDRPTMEVGGETVFVPPTILVKAKQFGWEFYYPGRDGKIETQDDLYIENSMVVPTGTEVVLQLESRDVIHSFFVAELRLKQDIVPGMTQFAWFRAESTGDFKILCTELCGWGHYKMIANLKIVSPAEYQEWLAKLEQGYYAKTDQ
jgi:cytochrome c oxidase subunit 2